MKTFFASGKLRAWLQASRLPFYVATFIPLFIGWALAIKYHGMVRPWRFLLVFLGSLMVHLLTNLANDYFDHLVGTDSGEAIGGSRVIQQGKITPGTMLRVIIILYILAFAIAFFIVFSFKLYLLAVPILFAAASSYFYTAPPVRYGYSGLGELFVAINMGPIMVVGTYWVITGGPDVIPLCVSIPVGLMVALILYYQSLPDMKTDQAAGKRTLAVRLGKRGAFKGLVLFFVLIYLSIVMLMVFGLLSWYSLAFSLSVPLAVKLIGIAHKTDEWVLLDRYGKYVRIAYFINGLAIIAGLL
ncbi:MAG TPA: 1,4-dihydroxy-2-naphthoate octaprenyltransferase [Syntrophorhabdaceae bacterium]|nr:1,4-dihydroxy-2-naphthoate octaprenyltransferase [Syntrophorhabdaceae bacterium]